jgi:hypothetical protein
MTWERSLTVSDIRGRIQQAKHQPNRTVLYTSPHSEVAPFQRVWNPDTNNAYAIDEFPEKPSGPDPVESLCGVDGTKCPELPAFNGEDYFDEKPLG